MSQTLDPGAPESVVRQRAEHNVSRRQMDADALRVMYRLMRNGFTAYLVGGGVRDLLLGREPKDFDVATDAHPRQIRKLFHNAFLIGRRFRLVHIRFGDTVIEVSTFRRRPDPLLDGAGEPDPNVPEGDNTFGTPEEDAWRRDFTINALFYDIRTYAIIDHVGGLRDLDERLIRCIGNPDERFLEDPVRMVRAVRFAARLGFHIEPDAYASIIRHHQQLATAAPPRLLEEIYKLFPFATGEAAFRLLRRTRLLAVMFPELDAFLDRDGPETMLFWKLLAGLDRHERERGKPLDPALIFATLFYAPFRERVRLEQRQDDVVRQASVARALVEPGAVRYRMPKRVFYRTIQLLDNQRRFEGDAQRYSRRFVAHEIFGDALVLRRLHLECAGEDLRALAPWLDAQAQIRQAAPAAHGTPHGDHGAPAADGARGDGPRRGRRRGGRGRGPRRESHPDGPTRGPQADAEAPGAAGSESTPGDGAPSA